MSSTALGLAAELDFALLAARRAGDSTLPAFRSPLREADAKSDGSLVTKTDKQTELMLRDMCERAYPDDGFWGEEFGESASRSGRRWIADPIDGTISFVHGVPLYGTLLALEIDGRPQVGVIHMPGLEETVYAAEGLGAWHIAQGSSIPARAGVRPCQSLDNAVVCATSPDYFNTPDLLARMMKIIDAAPTTRGWSDCYSHILLATGRIDCIVEPGVKPWDIAASAVIVREAGGRCTDWEGNSTIYSGNALLTGGALHHTMLDLLRVRAAD